MKVILSGGGTAGHINPALAIASYIMSKDKNAKILFVGTKRGLEHTLVPKAGFDIKYIKVEGLRKKLSFETLKSLYHMISAKHKCKKIIKDFKPDIVIGTGGYVCAPVVMAANDMNIPTLIHEQNVFAGSAIKLLSKKSTTTLISFDESRKYLKDAKNILFTGNPIRETILTTDRTKAREAFGLKDEKCLLIFGGSLGAKAINDVTLDYLKDLYENDKDKNIKVIFATGERNYDEVLSKAENYGILNDKRFVISKYIYNMDQALNASDAILSRSGAITVSEVCALSKPAIFVPSPNVTNNHQYHNAVALSQKGAAITIEEKDLNLEVLKQAVNSTLYDDVKINKIKAECSKIKAIDALSIIYDEIKRVTK